ncbi:MAG: glycosyltransferase family 2 protein, partial [Candidatus Limnocylindrales bacterium]
VVDDGSTDGTGDEARAHGADVVIRHEVRGGVGVAIRDGWAAGIARRRPYLALLSGDDQHDPGDLVAALDTLLREHADYVQGSRWMPGGRIVGMLASRQLGARLYSIAFSILSMRRVSDATNSFRIFRTALLSDPNVNIDQSWLISDELEAYVLYKAIRRGYRVVESPVTVRYDASRGRSYLRALRDWWRLFRPAVLLRLGVKH